MNRKEKCQSCKYWREEFSEWDYQTHVYCKLGINEPIDIEKCEHDKEKYNIGDYIDDCGFGLLIILGFVVYALISTICR